MSASHDWSRRRLLGAMSAPLISTLQFGPGVAAVLPERAGKRSGKTIIQVFLQGGPSHLDMLDPKPLGPSNIRGEFSSISTAIPEVQICEHLPRLAVVLNRCCVLRGFSHAITDHDIGSNYVLTGDRASSQEAPLSGSVIARDAGWQVPPPFVAIDHLPGGAAVLGDQWNPFPLNSDAYAVLRNSTNDTERRSSPAQRRFQLLNEVNRHPESAGSSTDNSAGYRESFRRAQGIVESSEFKKALDRSEEPAELLASYGDTRFGKRLLTARRLVEAGCRVVSVKFPGWDTHIANFSRMKKLLPEFDHAISALIGDLSDRGMMADTAVFAFGEFGRTPEISGKAGRGHWARASSVLCFGGGIREGLIWGATDATGSDPVDGVVSPEDLTRTLLHIAGVDATSVELPGGRSLTSGGRIVHEILG